MHRFLLWAGIGIELLLLWKGGLSLAAKSTFFILMIGSFLLGPFCLRLLANKYEDWNIFSQWPKLYFENEVWPLWMILSGAISPIILFSYSYIRFGVPRIDITNPEFMIVISTISLPSLIVLALLIYVWVGKALSRGLEKMNIPLGPGWRYTNSTIYQKAIDRNLTTGNSAFRILTDVYINSDAFNYTLLKALPLLSAEQAQQIIKHLETDIILGRPNFRYYFSRFVKSWIESGRIEGRVVDFYRENSFSSEADLVQNAIIDWCFDPEILGEIYEVRLFKNSQTRIKVLDKLFRMKASDLLLRLAVNTPRDYSASYIINLLKGDYRLIEVALNALDQENRNCAFLALSDEQKQRYQTEMGKRS
jgi:hypothetical protein